MAKVFIAMIVIGIVGLLVAALVEAKTKTKNPMNDNRFDVYAHCQDGIVCYYLDKEEGMMGCFRDKELVAKYCG